MRKLRLVCSLALLLFVFPTTTGAQTQPPGEEKSLGDIARELRNKKMTAQSALPPAPAAAQNGSPATSELKDDTLEIERLIDDARALLLREQFEALDKMADDLRSSKARFIGGGWKLTRFYEAVHAPENTSNATEADWKGHIALLERWKSARPQSITARVALADAYLEYAWAARGNGYADSVTPEGWRLFEERTKKSVEILIDATRLDAKCPQWYLVMQQAARAAGADKDQQRAVFEKAVAYEPTYFAYYQTFAYSLLPKWSGEPGDLRKFADETYRRVGGKEGAHIYFEIASSLCGTCGDFSTDDFSWKNLQEGYAALKEMYGVNPMKANRFAFIAAAYKDKDVAAKAFEIIGDRWDASAWGSRSRFESQREWAGLQATPPVSPRTADAPRVPSAPSSRVFEAVQIAEKARNESRCVDAKQFANQAIEIARPLPGTGSQMGRAYQVIADCERIAGNVTGAEAALDAAISAVSEKEGPNSVEMAMMLVQTAMYAETLNDYVKAEANLRRAIEIREQTNGAFDRELPNDIMILGDLCRNRGRNKEAIDLYQHAISVRESFHHDDIAIAGPLGRIGDMYRDMGMQADAEAAYLRLLHIYEGQFGLNSRPVVGPLSRLATLYQAMGKADDERKIQARLQAIEASGAR